MSGAPESGWPSVDEALAMLSEWEGWSKQAEALQDNPAKVFGDFVESPLSEMLHDLLDAYTRQVAARLGDQSQWMEWFHLENDMGANARCAGYDGRLTPVATLSDLLALIMEGRIRTP